MILSAVKAFLSTYRIYAEIAVAVIAISAFVWYRHSLIEQGVKQQQGSDAKLVAAKIIHNTEVETRAKTLADARVADFKATLQAPPAADAPHLSCVSNNSRPRSMSKDARSRPSPDATPQQPAVVEAVPQGSWDIGPDIDKRFHDDDALIAVLQDRIALEVGVCR